jgi:hypothetical protein
MENLENSRSLNIFDFGTQLLPNKRMVSAGNKLNELRKINPVSSKTCR